jgi:diaminopimelate epimerase
MQRSIPFIKATACGNDFLVIDGTLVPEPDLKAVTITLCDRHRGVGADGVEWLFPTEKADIYAHLINSDGSDAEVSGNGTRCVAAWLTWIASGGYLNSAHAMSDSLKMAGTKPALRVLTDAGVKTCTLVGRSSTTFEFRSDMGEPKVEGEIALSLGSGERRGIRLSMGNPQFIVFVDEFDPEWQRAGAEIESHREFPQHTNVEFVKVANPHEIEIRIFERGAGETQSSGTGSCASAVAAIHTGRAKSPVRVVSPGGPQTVEWQGGSVLLTGPATILCSGEFFF